MGVGKVEVVMKVCTKCKQIKPKTAFWRDKTTNSGLMSQCIECRKSNRDHINKRYRKYRQANKDRINARQRKYRQLTLEKRRECELRYYHSHKKANLPKHTKYSRERRQNNPRVRLECNVRNALSFSLKGNKKGHWENLVGYTLKQLKRHLEKQFKPGMTWENYGKGKDKWHLDHKIPVSAFNFTNAEHIDFKRCWALNNLQPMWQTENLCKQDKLERPFQPALAF